MKKILAMAAAALFFFTSCTGDDDSGTVENPDTNPLLKKTVTTDNQGNSYSETYNYDGNKITSITYDDGSFEKFTYAGGKLSKMEYIENDVVVEEITFSYDNSNRLASLTYLDFDFEEGERMTYTYNDNNTITTKLYTGSLTSQTSLDEIGELVMENGNITRFAVLDDNSEVAFADDYEFDDKHSPLKNVFAADVLMLSFLEGGVNNIIKNTTTPDNEEFITTYEYNTDGYPVKSTESFDNYVETVNFYYE